MLLRTMNCISLKEIASSQKHDETEIIYLVLFSLVTSKQSDEGFHRARHLIPRRAVVHELADREDHLQH